MPSPAPSSRGTTALLIAACATSLLAACGPTDTKANRPDAARAGSPDAASRDARIVVDARQADARPATDATATDATAIDARATDATDATTTDARIYIDADYGDAITADARPWDAGAPPYTHTIAIDGTNDFVTADERFASSSAGYFGYAAWDSTYLYVGFEGPDVGANSATRWVFVYLGGAPGTTAGVTYNTQQPALPFPAAYHVGWRSDNGLTQALSWNTSAWIDAGWDFTGDVFQTGSFMELRIPRADIGSPATVSLHLSMINEQGGVEGTYAAVPSGSFADGYDPDYARFFSFSLIGPDKPTDHASLP